MEAIDKRLVKVIEVLADKGSSSGVNSSDALKYTQAALNIANTMITLSNVAK